MIKNIVYIVISINLRLRLVTPTSTLIILDITETYTTQVNSAFRAR